MPTVPESLAIALEHQQAGRLPQAEAIYRQILRIQPEHPDALHLLGVIAHQAGQHDLAVQYIRQAIARNSQVPVFHNNIGEAYRAQGKLQEAVAHYRQALALEPANPEAHHNLGLVFRALGKPEEAVAHYRQALALRPAFAEAHINLGATLQDQGRPAEAEAHYRQAVGLRPEMAQAHYNLANVLKVRERLEEAEVHYRQALALQPALAEAHNNLGNLLKDHGRLEEAVAHYRQALVLRPAIAEIHNNLGSALRQQGKTDEAIPHYQKALALRPTLAEAHINLGTALEAQGKWQGAETSYRNALAIRPNDGIRIKLATLLPVIIESDQDLMDVRKEYHDRITTLLEEDLSLADPVKEIGRTHFYLAYHGMNDRDLQRKTAQLYRRACPSLSYTASHCSRPPQSSLAEKIRIGFLSKHFRGHTIGQLTRGIIAQLSRSLFEVTLFSFPQSPDHISEFIRQRADRTIVLPYNLEAARSRIANEQLDILFYPDLGMEPLTYFLAFSRLAPVQCVTWGHPVTTGIPTMDYFVSSQHLEPDSGQEHYTERLIRLNHLPTYYYRPAISAPPTPRAHFGLDPGGTLYLCPQSLFKLHPDYDPVLGNILRADQRGLVCLIHGQERYWTNLLMTRFQKTIPDVLNRVRFLPWQDTPSFLQLLSVVDVMLDPLHWSGGNTTLEALSLGLPVVTLPGAFMRGRVTYGCYKQMGMMELVADTTEEYVERAVCLGTDAAYRERIRAQILSANKVLYENAEIVRELEQFFLQATGRVAQATSS